MKMYQESSPQERIAFWLMVGVSLLPLVPYAFSQ
ncbi:hypothetical protein DFR50_10842 [Roseiarcus fermentans]|uniref:Uncharacterized protein n=1 Tax=Roseiarcus fermentans TaxID=1473586 RepID=A0A366FMY0_9HYPH|nr:hypothetical protein DFR50_10842 [Roseiarcus fermentans]